MSTERLIAGDQLPSSVLSSSHSIRYASELGRIFEELPNATIVSVSRPDASDITPLLLSYTIELEYKQVNYILCIIIQCAFHLCYSFLLFTCIVTHI